MLYVDTIVQKVSDHALQTRGKRLDAQQTAHLTRELSQILPEVLEVKYPELKMRSFVPVKTGVERGAEYVIQKIYDRKGLAQIVTSQMTQLPKLDLIASEEIRKIEEVAGFYEYTIRDLEAAAFAGVSLTSEKGKVARRQMETTIDKYIAKGVGSYTGFFNNTNVPQYIFNTGMVALPSLTGEAILQGLHDWRNSVNVQSGGVFTANTAVLSQKVFNHVSSRPYSTTVPQTIGSLFKEQTGVELDFSLYANDANFDGYGAGHDVGIMYFKDPEVVTFVNPVPYEEAPPQDYDLKFKIPVRETFGPVEFHQPLGASVGIFTAW